MTPGERIKAERERLGLSQLVLAESAGIDPSTLRDLENGITRRPQRQTIAAIASALDMNLSDLGYNQDEVDLSVATSELAEAAKLEREPVYFRPRFAFCRQATGHSRLDAAKRLGMRASTLAAYESCQAVPTANTILKMAALYGVSCDYLLGMEPDPYKGRWCMFAYCEAGLPHDHCCMDCSSRADCAEACASNPEECGGVRTRRPHEMFRRERTG